MLFVVGLPLGAQRSVANHGPHATYGANLNLQRINAMLLAEIEQEFIERGVMMIHGAIPFRKLNIRQRAYRICYQGLISETHRLGCDSYSGSVAEVPQALRYQARSPCRTSS